MPPPPVARIATGGRVPNVKWKDDPNDADLPAAEAYLCLLAEPAVVAELLKGLRKAPLVYVLAKDILRAAGLNLLAVDDAHVAADLKTITKGRPLSPVLLVRGDLRGGVPLQIAEGYHRVCAVYHVDESTPIPCRIAGRSVRPGS
jgi:hypothetical protein